MTAQRLPRSRYSRRPTPGQLVLAYHLIVIDGGRRTTPAQRPALTVIPGGRLAPEPDLPAVATASVRRAA